MALLNIIVCVKQVPDTIEVRLDPDTHTLIREGVPSVLNPFDEFAVEEAVRLREKFGGTVTAVTMGPPKAEDALRTCLAMGSDTGCLLCDPKHRGARNALRATRRSSSPRISPLSWPGCRARRPKS